MLTNFLRLLLSRQIKPLYFDNNNTLRPDLSAPRKGIYVHIPFCQTLCRFCPYNKVVYDPKLAAEFVEALIAEIKSTQPFVGNHNDITSIYFGGGSPALVAPDLKHIINAIRSIYELNGDIGVELHPRDVTAQNIEYLKAAGVTMVSVGIQSFQKACLKALGRKDNPGCDKLQTLQAARFRAIDVDLIFGIPGQSVDDLVADFICAVSNGATQVSTYPFIDFSFANNDQKPLGATQKRQMLNALIASAQKYGYERSSVWTFARTGTPQYSSVTRDNFIGFGPSASSLLRDEFNINTFSVPEYIRAVKEGRSATTLTMHFNDRSRALFWLFWNAYNLNLSEKVYFELFGTPLKTMFAPELALARLLQLVVPTEYGYRLTKFGAYIFHLVEQAYTHNYIDKVWSTARSEAWPMHVDLY